MVWIKVKTVELVRLQHALIELGRWGASDELCATIDGWMADPARQLAPEPPQRISVPFAAVKVGTGFWHAGVAYHRSSAVSGRHAEPPHLTRRFRAGDVVDVDRAPRTTGEGGRK